MFLNFKYSVFDISISQASSGRERPLCRQRHLIHTYQIFLSYRSDPEPDP